jgi:hypothetical protein
MNFWARLLIIAFWPLAAAIVILVGRVGLQTLPQSAVEAITASHRWLEIVAVLYIANYLVAWRFSDSWPISMARMLIWAVIAYLGISNVVDIFGENRAYSWQILGFEEQQNPAHVSELRSRFIVWTLALIMSLVCIGIGFERNSGETNS